MENISKQLRVLDTYLEKNNKLIVLQKMTITKKLSFNLTIVFAIIMIIIYLFSDKLILGQSETLNDSQYLKSKYLLILRITFILLIIFTFIISYLISTRFTKNITDLNKFVVGLNNRDTHIKIEMKASKEINDLANALNNLAEKTDNEQKSIEKLERIRSEFLGNVSHELRTPIFSIQGYIETLLDGAVHDNAVNIEFLNKIKKHSDRLNNLLYDLIEISRIESREVKLSFRFFDLQEFISTVVEEIKPKVIQRNLKITFKPLNIKEIVVYADKDRIRQVIVNLIDNAIKYNRENGMIEVLIGNDKNFATVTIQDSGIGIPKADIPRIFERFYRVDKNRSREVGGTGLGLAIVKHIIEAHKGEVSVESKTGEGSKFSFKLSKNAF